MLMSRYRSITLAFTVLLLAGCGYLLPRQTASGPALVDNEVLFRFWAPNARRVQLGGDWPQNNWTRGDGSAGEANIGLMEDKDGDGVWEIRVDLPPGRYHYLFLVDENTWHTDPGNPEEVRGGPAELCSRVVLHTKNDRLEIR